jgi:DNA-binding transcriptional LysR family regulator
LNWDDLKLFLAVSRCGTISGAAKQFNVQHSTVSRRIKALEESLGVSLLRRANNVYQLTVEGIKLESAAIRMESEVIGVDGALLGKNDSLVGPLRVTTINSMSSSVLMPIFNSFCKAYPKIGLDIIVSNETVSLGNREADIAIRLTNNPPDMLIGKRITTVVSTVYGSARYLQDLKGSDKLKWIGAKCCNYHDSWTKQSCKERMHQFNSNDAITILSAVREGLGVTFLPCFIGDSETLLERYCDPEPKFDLGFWVLLHPELKHNARVLAFRNHLTLAVEAQHQLFTGIQNHPNPVKYI